MRRIHRHEAVAIRISVEAAKEEETVCLTLESREYDAVIKRNTKKEQMVNN